MSPRDTIVVTGIGAVSGFGWGTAALWQGLSAGRHAIRDFDRFDHRRHRTHVAAQVPAPPDTVADAAGDTASLADAFAVAAADEALRQAGLRRAIPGLRGAGAGVFFGSSTGGMFESEGFFEALLGERGSRRLRLHELLSQPPSGPGDAVARAFGVRGPVQTISSACASATLAIGIALESLREGETEVALAGGSDSLCRLTFAGFNSLRSVDAGPCRPFRHLREGLSLGEGGAVLVLETLAHAEARGARPLAIVAGAGGSCDAHHMTAPDPSGVGVVRAIRAALADAEVEADAVSFVNAHGTGTPLNDAAEWAALSEVFGARAGQIPVTSTKGNLGHFLGSAGAIEAVATVLCLEHGAVHPTPGDGPIDPASPVDLVLGAPRAVPTDAVALSTNFAFGGSNAAAVFRGWPQAAGSPA
ncbi:MAG: beta-ketoacyl-[acyl-carrier-protein] synthase family protein [Acidobacteriota bacterium]